MNVARTLDLVLLWHMHQPDYRDRSTGEYRMPWAYLHAIKDYGDMAWHLEQHPRMRAVVNFSPVLLDQLDDYARQLTRGPLRDPLLRLLARSDGRPLSDEERACIVQRCAMPGYERMFRPLAAYKGLRELFSALEACSPGAASYLSDQYLFDLLTWFHLAWTGETVRRSSPTVLRLMSRGGRFGAAERLELVAVIGEVVSGLVERYRRLASSGSIELSTTPGYHPLAPLLLSLASAREVRPQTEMPDCPQYPGGRERLGRHLQAAKERHVKCFGEAPRGLWPAEGAISAPFIAMLEEQDYAWTASSQFVLVNSLRAGGQPVARDALTRPYRLASTPGGPTLFFRDDRLSDLIGFVYAKWNSNDAAGDLVARLEAIAGESTGEAPVICVILDGENCWAYYDYNGYYFLEELYRRLEAHPMIRPTTFSAYLGGNTPPAALRRLVAGSWSRGHFEDWIGATDKNRAWDLLCAAKQTYDLVLASGRLDAAQCEQASEQLAACEGSDWFWWPGSSEPAAEISAFDALFRAHLGNLYAVLGLPVPAPVQQPSRSGAGEMRIAQEVS